MTGNRREKKANSEALGEPESNRKDKVDKIFEKLSSLEDSSVLEYENKKDPVSAPVCLKYKAYKRMVGYAIRHANNHLNQKEWKEVYGILIGFIEDNSKVIVKNAIPVCVGMRTGVELEPIHYVDLSQIDASIYEKAIEDKNRDFIIGWWHTHPGFSFFFSEVDRTTHLGYQVPNPFAVGLIFDHCEKKSDFLGVAALRLKNPERGILSNHKIVELYYDLDVKTINQKIKKVIEDIQKNMKLALKELDYINNVLRKKELSKLQRNFGLVLVPKDTNSDMENQIDIQDENQLYIWDPKSFKKTYKIPKFREKFEENLLIYSLILKNLLKMGETAKFEARMIKYKKKLKGMLEKPNQLYNRLMNDFIKRIDIISPYYDYLDTDERLIIEKYEESMTEYYKILTSLNTKAELNLKA